ncbi:unnamed protein product [Brassica napus]|uniref:(rape) hypothetical protein n=1 Tax=Brassica napus TaxID=3708 RepID=A0A816NX98_BRANA|nr:unnamed protein product [Brassica napus]
MAYKSWIQSLGSDGCTMEQLRRLSSSQENLQAP